MITTKQQDERLILVTVCTGSAEFAEHSLDELENFIPTPCLEDGIALGRAINAYLSTLNRENRVIFLRRYWFGDSVKDISTAFHMTENAVSVRLSRIRNGLKDYLIKEGYYYE